jgi:hypothetical protein
MTLQTLVAFIESPTSGIRYQSVPVLGLLRAPVTNVTFKLEAFSGASGGGSLVVVTDMEVFRHDVTSNTDVGSFSGSGIVSVTTAGTAGTAGHCMCVGAHYDNGTGLGSLKITASWDNADAILQAVVRKSASDNNGGWWDVIVHTRMLARRSGASWVDSGTRYRTSGGVWFG